METNDNEKDTILIKSRKFSMWRVVLATLLVLFVLYLGLNYILNQLDRSICESNLISFRNAVIIFEQVHGRYPNTLQELEYETGLMGYLDSQKYQWIPSDNGNPPVLICNKFNLSSK